MTVGDIGLEADLTAGALRKTVVTGVDPAADPGNVSLGQHGPTVGGPATGTGQPWPGGSPAVRHGMIWW